MNKKESTKKQKTKKDLLEELTALRQELENVQSTQAEMKKDKEALWKKEEFLFNIFSAIQEGISVLDSELNILFINPTIERWIPHDRPLVGRKCYDAYHGRSQRCELCPCFETLQTGQVANEIIPVLDTKGEISGWSHHFSYPLQDSQTGHLIGVIEYVRNVTKRKQAEESLKASEEKYRSILENLADGYYETDLAGHFTFFNDELTKIFNYTRDQLLGMNNREYTDAGNAKKIYQAFNQVYRTGEPTVGFRFETIAKDKTRRNVELSISLIRDASGKPLGFRGIARDITNHIKMQNALRESEERYRTIIEAMEEGYYENDLAGNLTFVNEAMARFLGYSRAEMLGMNSRQYIDAENSKIIYQGFNQLFRTGKSAKSIQYEIIAKDGEKRFVETSPSLIRNQLGDPIGFRGISRDITDLMQTQKALQESEERYRTIIETIEDAYYEMDLAGNFTFFNAAMFRIIKYPMEEMVGLNYRQFTDTENGQILFEAFNRVYLTGEPCKSLQFNAFDKNGVMKSILTSVSLIMDGSGKPVGFRGVSKDITGLIQIQIALRESEERYRTIIETIEDGYFEVDLAGNLTYFNDTLVRIHGYPRAEMEGMNNRQYTDAENAKILYKAFNKVYRTGEPSKGTHYEIIAKGGRRKNLESSISLIKDSDGKPVGFRGIVRDVTELKQAQKALQSSEERFRIAAESTNDFIYEWDLKTGQYDWFGMAVEKLRNSLGELPTTEKIYERMIHPDDLERISNAARLHISQGRPFLEEYRMIGNTGNIMHVKDAAMCLRSGKGRAYKWIGAISDITEHKKAEQALQASEERFRIAAESTNDFIYEWDLNTGRLEWFGAAVDKLAQIFGRLPVTNTAFDKLIYPEDSDRILEAIRRHLKQGVPYMEEFRLIGKTGDIVHFKAAGMCLRDETGRAYKWVGALSDISERKRTEEELKQSFEKVRKAMGGIIQAMALTVESKDPYTAGHQQRVSSLARTIAQEMGLSKDQIEAIRLAGVVHDLGKISVPAEILSKPTRLSDLEFSLIKGHPQTSYEILRDIDFPWPIAQIALQHHERMNGSGYPAGLKGEEIMFEAQVLMVADVVEAIASHRPYRAALGIDEALEEIAKNKGTLYSPAVVEACLRLFREKGFVLDKSLFPAVGP